MPISLDRRSIRTLSELDVSGKGVFCRLDLNVPMVEGKVTDDARIRASIPTLRYLLDRKARMVLASHLGRPKGKADPKYSLIPVGERLAELLSCEVIVPEDCIGDAARRVIQTQREGDVVLLENLRFHAEEEKNDRDFALELRHGLAVYVSDAFGALHRAHASTYALPSLFEELGAGLLVELELQHLLPLRDHPEHPYVAILGGAKVSDKLPVLDTFLGKVDRLLLGGAMVFTFLRALGRKTGRSLVEEAHVQTARSILERAEEKKTEIVLPKDFLLGDSMEAPGTPVAFSGRDLPDGKMGLDVGPETMELFGQKLEGARTIFWNGPLGLFEKPPFDRATNGLAVLLSTHPAVKVVGGGDSVAAVTRAGVASRMTHISTGGGATLEFLEGKALPGLEALAV